RDAFLTIPTFDGMHRFLPALFLRQGYRVAYQPVGHRPRERGVSKYSNIRRAMIGISDLLGVWWLMRRARRPMVSETAVSETAVSEAAVSETAVSETAVSEERG